MPVTFELKNYLLSNLGQFLHLVLTFRDEKLRDLRAPIC